MVDAVNIFLFTDLLSSASSEASLLAMRWDAILGGEAQTYFLGTILPVLRQKFVQLTSGRQPPSKWRCGE